MSPPRRRSARLASASKTPRAAAQPRLVSVIEGDEDSIHQQTQSLDAILSSPTPKPATPASAGPIKLPKSEMHPSKVHQTMAPPSSGLRLGFVDINANEKSRDQPSGITQTTPSKSRMPASDFTFRIASPMGGDMDLGPEARQMMEQLRERAAQHKAKILANREKEREQEEAQAREERKFAKAKGKMGRFSDVHMKEFKKMDSIAAPSTATVPKAFNFSPLKSGIKRSQSKANIDEQQSGRKMANIDKALPRANEKQRERREQSEATVKRVRQRIEDDASTLRPNSRDGSQIPRPKSSGNDSVRAKSGGNEPVRAGIPRSQTLPNLMTPTKASAARAHLIKTPTISLVKSPSKPDDASSGKYPGRSALGSLVKAATRPDLSSLVKSPNKTYTSGSLKKSATINSLGASQGIPSLVQTPGRFDRVKSILKRQFSASKPKSHLPQFAGSAPKTPGRTEMQIPSGPMTTPGQKFTKHVEFTPDTKQAALSQNSPSPTKSSLPKSRTFLKLPQPNFPSVGAVIGARNGQDEITYPDLSAYRDNAEDEDTNAESGSKGSSVLPEGVPGTFTFRSDHTIRFDNTSPNGFGGAAGQASLRQVRSSLGPAARMPGAYPTGREICSPNKENRDPGVMPGIPHGMSNKKRHRAVWDDEEVKTGISHGISNKKRHRADSDDDLEQDEGTQRGAKKLRKDPKPAEIQAFVSPRLVASPSPMKKKQLAASSTPSPQKKGISLSRLNMLARPKVRQ